MEIRQINLGIVRAASIALVLVACTGCRVSANDPDPPRVAGQQVPRESIELDFNRRFNVHTRLEKEKVFNDCRFVGFLEEDGQGTLGAKFGKLMSSPRGWLVIEQLDRRRVYIPADSIIYFEDAGANEDAR